MSTAVLVVVGLLGLMLAIKLGRWLLHIIILLVLVAVIYFVQTH